MDCAPIDPRIPFGHWAHSLIVEIVTTVTGRVIEQIYKELDVCDPATEVISNVIYRSERVMAIHHDWNATR